MRTPLTAARPPRRRLLKALAGGAVAVAGVGAAARSAGLLGLEPDAADQGLLRLAGGAMGVEMLRVPLTERVLRPEGDGAHAWRTATLRSTTHTMVGFTWRRGGAEPHIQISSLAGGRWHRWQPMPHAHDAPEAHSAEESGTVGTGLAWTGPAEGVRVRVRGALPPDFAVVLLHPRPLAGDRRVRATAPSVRRSVSRTGAAAAANGQVPAPALLTRADWGANESWRSSPPRYNPTLQQVHIHHTANSNTYTRDDVPALIRGMYAYHTQSLGWSDIAYNFLVDRFGRTWEGRYGGPARLVRGAHTLGFNATSTGISVIGNYDTAQPGSAVIDAIAQVAAWKLDPYHRDPQGRALVTSEGSDKFGSGRQVSLPVIDGHRDTNDTECPGQHLYDALPLIRRQTQSRIQAAHVPAATITKPFTTSGTSVDGQVLAVTGGTWSPADATPTYMWFRDDAVLEDERDSTYLLTTADVGCTVSAQVQIAPDGYQPASQKLTFEAPVKARSTVQVRAAGRRGRMIVQINVAAAGAPAPVTGSVVVTTGQRTRTVDLQDGAARVVFRWLPAGSYTVTATYAGTGTVAGSTGSGTATVSS